MLDRTSLSRVIQATTSVTDWLDFIAALEHLVFDPEANKLTREREHLHRMLERELWVFGEQYNMMISERSLTAVLERHLHLLGRGGGTRWLPSGRYAGHVAAVNRINAVHLPRSRAVRAAARRLAADAGAGSRLVRGYRQFSADLLG